MPALQTFDDATSYFHNLVFVTSSGNLEGSGATRLVGVQWLIFDQEDLCIF